MFWVYVLKSESGRIYTGQTNNLARRVLLHSSGMSFWTSREKNWRLIYSEEFTNRSEAMRRERELKSGKGRDELKRKGIV